MGSQISSSSIVLGGGCFWCLEAIFQEVIGVHTVQNGYAGGVTKNPSYEEVARQRTGHAEVVQVTYDKNVIQLEKILEIFWTIHDPTTPNRQGADIGPEYRSIILYSSNKDKKVIDTVRYTMQKVWDAPIITEVAPLTTFYPAEDYHANYYRKNQNNTYCQVVINPKLQKFRSAYSQLRKSEDVH